MNAPTVTGTHVEIADLVVRYGKRTALAGLDLDLGAGVHGLLGPNGAGKTTLMRVLATVATPTSGRVTVLGSDLSDQRSLREVRRRLGYLPQQFGYYPRFRVREFVEYFAWLKEMPADDVPTAVDRAIDRVGLTDRADDKLKKLSGGMLRRVGIAQAIVNDPDLLLLDEPTAGLDPEQRVDFRELLRSIGVDACVLVATHLVEDVTAACTNVTIANEGRAIFRGTPDDLIAAGEGTPDGDTPIERGYTAVLRTSRR
ncbi:MAG: ABC transporter ATP-binding protein [Jiangellaceae bacterium]